MPDLPDNAVVNYLADGFYVAQGLADPNLIDSFLHDMSRIICEHLAHYGLPVVRKYGFEALHDNLATMHRFNQHLYLATLRVYAKLRSLYDVFLTQDITNACHKLGVELPLLHTHPLFHIMSNRLLIEDGYHGFDAHQDWTGLQTSLNTVVVWVPFHDIDKTRFPLELLPKSHLQGLSPGVVRQNEFIIDNTYLENAEFVTIEVAGGDVVFMSPFTVHRTGLTDSAELRVAASWRYEDAIEETFIDRGYPFAQSRVVQHDLFTPGFPNREQIAAFIHKGR